jgi:hypothetical protein
MMKKKRRGTPMRLNLFDTCCLGTSPEKQSTSFSFTNVSEIDRFLQNSAKTIVRQLQHYVTMKTYWQRQIYYFIKLLTDYIFGDSYLPKIYVCRDIVRLFYRYYYRSTAKLTAWLSFNKWEKWVILELKITVISAEFMEINLSL